MQFACQTKFKTVQKTSWQLVNTNDDPQQEIDRHCYLKSFMARLTRVMFRQYEHLLCQKIFILSLYNGKFLQIILNVQPCFALPDCWCGGDHWSDGREVFPIAARLPGTGGVRQLDWIHGWLMTWMSGKRWFGSCFSSCTENTRIIITSQSTGHAHLSTLWTSTLPAVNENLLGWLNVCGPATGNSSRLLCVV